jgi:hypothetical protein
MGRKNQMPVLITVGFMLLIWAVVLWGSTRFNNNVH